MASNPAEEITPYRDTRIHLDLPAFQTLQQGFIGTRYGADIAPFAAQTGGKNSSECDGVRYWPGAKCWTLQPLQEKIGYFQEALPTNVVVADLYLQPRTVNIVSNGNLQGAFLAEYAAWNPPYSVGMVYRGDTLYGGGVPFYMKNVAADGTWDATLTASPSPPQGNVLSSPGSSNPPPNVSQFDPPVAPMDTIYDTDTLRPDQGFVLRWVLPGTQLQNPDYVLNFYFGQYCVAITGDGIAHLCEWCRQTSDSDYRWLLRTTFRYCRQSQVSGISHALLIFPVMSKNGPVIEFSGSNVEGAQLDGDVATPLSYSYEANPLNRFGDVDESPGHVTRAGEARLDVRRDLRVGFNLSPLLWVKTGLLYDGYWGEPDRGESEKRVVLDRVNVWPPDYGGHESTSIVTGYQIDPATGEGVDGPSSGPYGIRFNLLGHNSTKAISPETPLLYGYRVVKDAVVEEVDPATYTDENDDFAPLSFPIRTADFSCQGPNPQGDNGQVELYLSKDEGQRLRNRGLLDVKLTTTAKAPDGTDHLVTLFRGEVMRPHYFRQGLKDADGPLDKPYRHSLLLSGYANKLQNISSRTITFQGFSSDNADGMESPSPPLLRTGEPWKVTDVITYLLKLAFPESMVTIFDNPIRLFPNGNQGSQADQFYDPNVNILTRCQALARNYLGASLIFDCNAGPVAPDGRPDAGSPEGAWMLLVPPPETAEPVLHFVEGPADDGVIRLPMAQASYPDYTVVATGELEGYVLPPEVNHVYVFTALGNGTKGYKRERHLYNVLSYKAPGFTTNPDPNSPHYVGYEKLYILPDPSLTAPGNTPESEAATQRAVDFVARRVMDYAGRGAWIQPIYGPLQFVMDSVTERLRVPRFGDPVSWQGESGWFIRSVSPTITAQMTDRAQMAHYELMKLAPLYTTPES